MNLATEVIAREGIKNEVAAINRNLTVAKQVRGVMDSAGAPLPGKLLLEPESISAVKKRLNPPEPKTKVTNSRGLRAPARPLLK